MQRSEPIAFETPTVEDSQDVWQLVKDSKVLDVNSAYAYMLLCSHFAETSILAKQDEDVVGVITGYRLPKDPKTLFVWQVAVDERVRGQSVAGRMLEKLLENQSGVEAVKTTVSPSNKASRRFFEKFAKRVGATVSIDEGFSEDLFPGGAHEEEPLLTIGPLEPLTV